MFTMRNCSEHDTPEETATKTQMFRRAEYFMKISPKELEFI